MFPLNGATPPVVEQALQRALDSNPARRCALLHEFWLEFTGAAQKQETPLPPARRIPARVRVFTLIGIVCLLCVIGTGFALSRLPVGPAPTHVSPTKTLTSSAFPALTSTRAPTWTLDATNTTQSSITTPDPFHAYAMDMLRMRQYGGGNAENLETMETADSFVRYSIRYPSDGLKIYGYMSIPVGDGPFPVIIVLHGYVNQTEYKTLDYITDAADGLARQGYIVIHPNLRNYPPSDKGDALFRVGYAIDVLNLIALVRQNAGQPGLFEKVTADRIGIWSHSMGGDIALRVVVISHDIKAIVLYSSMSGDEQRNSQFFNLMTNSNENKQELLASPQSFAAISPSSYYKDISAAIQLHHGTADSVIPLAWAQETCQALKDAGRNVNCYYYDGADHTFRIRYLEQFVPLVNDFFAKYLK